MAGSVGNFEDWNDESAAEEAQKMESEDSGSGKFYKIKVGRTVVRFLPPPLGVKSPFMVVYQHYVDLPSGKSVQFQCPVKMADPGVTAHCPACVRSDKLKRSGSQTDRDVGFSIAAKRRVYANVIVRSEQDKGPQILGIGKGMHEELLKIRRDPDAGGNYTHPTNGYDIVIERTGTTKNDTEYSIRMAPRVSALGNMEWIESQHNLGELLKVPTAQEIEAMLKGETPDKKKEQRSAANQPSSTVEDDMQAPATGGWGNRRTPQKDANGDDIPF